MTYAEYETKLAMYQTSDAPIDMYKQTTLDVSNVMTEQTELTESKISIRK